MFLRIIPFLIVLDNKMVSDEHGWKVY